MPHNTSPPRERKKSQPEAMEKSWYYSRYYSTDDLFCLFEAARTVNFTALPVLKYNKEVSDAEKNFLLTSLLIKRYHTTNVRPNDLTLETIIHDETQHQFYKDTRISVNIDKANVPFAIADLVKRGFSNWDLFHDDTSPALTGAHGNLKAKLEMLISYITTQLNPSLNKDDISLLSSGAYEFRNPELFHDIETALIDFIAEMTVGGNIEKAKVVHEYIALCKKMLYQMSQDQTEREKMARVLSTSIIDGLQLGLERSVFTGIFVGAALNLSIRSSLFDSEYDPDVYMILQSLKQACADVPMAAGALGTRGIPSLTIPHHFNPLRRNHENYYKQIIELFFENTDERQKSLRNNAVLNYFVNVVTTHCQVDELEKAAHIHNVICLLGKLYREDAHSPTRNNQYGKVLRNLLSIPSENAKVDNIFDEAVAPALFETMNQFRHLFAEKHYLKNMSRTMNTAFYQHLQGQLNLTVQIATTNQRRVEELEEVIALKTAANKHLEEKVKVKKQESKLATLKLKDQLGKLSSAERVKMEMVEQALDARQQKKMLVKQENHDRYLQRQLSSTMLIDVPLSELKMDDEVVSTSPTNKHRGILHIFRSSKEKSPTLERKHKHKQGESHSPPTERAYKRSQSEMTLKKKH